MHSEQCNLSRRDVRHSQSQRRERGRRVGGGGGSLLIEFPDNTEINLTPLKSDYSSAAVLSPSPCCECYASFFSISPPFILSVTFLLCLANALDPDLFEFSALCSMNSLNYICARIGTVHLRLSSVRRRILYFI